MLELKIDKGTEYVTGWKSKGFREWKCLPLHGALMPNANQLAYKIRIQFNSTPLVIVENNFTTKILNAYIVYELDSRPNIFLNNFKIESCLFGATNIVKKAF